MFFKQLVDRLKHEESVCGHGDLGVVLVAQLIDKLIDSRGLIRSFGLTEVCGDLNEGLAVNALEHRIGKRIAVGNVGIVRNVLNDLANSSFIDACADGNCARCNCFIHNALKNGTERVCRRTGKDIVKDRRQNGNCFILIGLDLIHELLDIIVDILLGIVAVNGIIHNAADQLFDVRSAEHGNQLDETMLIENITVCVDNAAFFHLSKQLIAIFAGKCGLDGRFTDEERVFYGIDDAGIAIIRCVKGKRNGGNLRKRNDQFCFLIVFVNLLVFGNGSVHIEFFPFAAVNKPPRICELMAIVDAERAVNACNGRVALKAFGYGVVRKNYSRVGSDKLIQGHAVRNLNDL